MRKRLRDMRSVADMKDSIRTIRGLIEYALWYLTTNRPAGRATDCELIIVGYTMYSSDNIEVVSGYKYGDYGACQRTTGSYLVAPGLYYYRHEIKFGKYPGSAYNQYADRGDPDCPSTAFAHQSDPYQEYVGVGWGSPSSGGWTLGMAEDHGTYWQFNGWGFPALSDLCDDPIHNLGWFYTNKLIRTFRIVRDETPGIDTMDGATYNWYAEAVGSAGISATVTPDSGSYTWAHGETEKFIEITLELTGVSGMENKWTSEGKRINLVLQQNARKTDCMYNHTWFVV